MKKIISVFSLVLLLTFCLLLTVSCSGAIDEVSNFKLDTETLTLSWDRVLGAKNYSVLVSGEDFEKSTKQNKISLEYLKPGTYEIKVKANCSDSDKKDSGWASYTFVREEESGLRYKLINNKTAYQLVGLGEATGDIVMDDTYRGKPVISIADKALSGKTKVTSFVVGKNVVEIGKSAFSRCSELTSITIPETVTKIGASCFQSCRKLTSITLPSALTRIEEYTFSKCYELKTVSLGDNIEFVGTYAFSNCEVLEQIIFADALKTVESFAFSDCKALATVDLGDSIEVIGDSAFYNDLMLSELGLGTSLKIIEQNAFINCDAITSITVPDSCHTIGNYAFRYCDNLVELKLGEGDSALTSVGYGIIFNTKLYNDAQDSVIIDGWYLYSKNKKITDIQLTGVYGIALGAFNNCEELIDFEAKGVKYVCGEAFRSCGELMYVTFDSSLLTIGSMAFKDCKVLRNFVMGSKITSIGDFAFSGCKALTPDSIFEVDKQKTTTFPKTLTSIGKDAFKGINNPIKATDNNVIYVKNWAVGYNTGTGGMVMAPSQISIKKSGTIGIANYAFSEIPIAQSDLSIFGIDIIDSVQYIGRGAFYKTCADYVVTVRLPKGLKEIGDYAFYGARGAYFEGNERSLEIPAGTTYIGRSAFYNCQSIHSLYIPESILEISPYAFYGCINLGAAIEGEKDDDPDIPGTITLEEGVQKIHDKAFSGCTSITELVIPDSITYIGVRAFYKCEGLKTLTIGTGITEIPNYAFYGCTLLETVVMSDSVTSVGNYAFRGCNSLTAIKFSSNLKVIGDFAFLGAEHLTELVIPDGVTSIGKHAFRDMKRAHSIIIPNTVTEVGPHAFYGATVSAIYVEAGASVDKWDSRWNSSFAPVYTDCTLSEDRAYVESFVKSDVNPDNFPVTGKIAAPIKEGYTFVGFSATSGSDTAEYTLDSIAKAPNGERLYTVWSNNETE